MSLNVKSKITEQQLFQDTMYLFSEIPLSYKKLPAFFQLNAGLFAAKQFKAILPLASSGRLQIKLFLVQVDPCLHSKDQFYHTLEFIYTFAQWFEIIYKEAFLILLLKCNELASCTTKDLNFFLPSALGQNLDKQINSFHIKADS